MGLFNRGKDLPDFLDDMPAQVNFETVLVWLKGLSDEDYKKAVDVANIHRKAQKEAAKVLGVEVEVRSYIKPPTIINYEILDDSILDDDDLELDLINDRGAIVEVEDKK